MTLLAFCTVATQAQITAIKAGKLIIPETGATATDQVILIEGEKIKAVGASLPMYSSVAGQKPAQVAI